MPTPPTSPEHPTAPSWGRWLLGFAAAFFVLNTLLSFENRWPGAGVRFGPRLSFELCIGVLLVLAWVAWRGRLGARAVSALAALYTVLVLARYADVTAPALFGRPVHLYWDGRHAAELLHLATASHTPWQIAAAALALLLGLAALYVLVRRAIALLAARLAWRRPRPWLLAACTALSLSFAAHPYVGRDTRWFFSLPVSPTLARQALLLPTALAPQRVAAQLPPGPRFDTGDVGALHGADVLLIFAESYGVTTLDDPTQDRALAPRRDALAQALRDGGRHVVSARVRSPTFGGASWLAHAALLTGVDTRDPLTHDRLLTTGRATLVQHFARHGYRSVGWMPGLQKPWPEGAFYGYERRADAATLGYRGPDFGYWRIPDQAALALLHAQELTGDARAPRFVVFPTISSHAPFRPLAPYHDDWSGLLRADAYSAAEQAAALAAPVAWLDPVPAYLAAIGYTFDWLGGYLRGPAPPGLLTIVIGDHQPLARVTGPGASWEVPVHLISRDAALLRRFEAAGFEPGLAPRRPALGGMHELTALLLRGFDGGAAAPSVPRVAHVDAAGVDVARGRVGP